MKRRAFLKSVATATATGGILASGSPHSTAAVATAKTTASTTPTVLKTYTAEDHRRRLENIRFCQRDIRTCLRKHLITNYLPGQCMYHIGEYPARKPWDIGDWHEQELDKLRDDGIGLIQLHEEWNDSQRLFGGHKFTPVNPAAFRRFVDMVHKRGMKVILYISSGYFERRDPDFREEWARSNPTLVEMWYQYAKCSPASPGWRAYLLSHVVRILDEYGVDGIYNDMGYFQPPNISAQPKGDQVLAFEETKTHDGALEDLLALCYAEVNRRGGIVKVHRGGLKCPQTALKVYDYLWVGEGIGDSDRLRGATMNHPPYVVPWLDTTRAGIPNEDELYLHSIPYMQFPLLLAGRPRTGECTMVPGIECQPEEKCHWTRCSRKRWRYLQDHPEDPYFHKWDPVLERPGRPDIRPAHARWLKQYLPMVEEGTWAWLDIRESDLFAQPPSENVTASAFAGRELYLVLANYGRDPVQIGTSAAYVPVADPSSGPRKRWDLKGRSLHILRRPGRE